MKVDLRRCEFAVMCVNDVDSWMGMEDAARSIVAVRVVISVSARLAAA